MVTNTQEDFYVLKRDLQKSTLQICLYFTVFTENKTVRRASIEPFIELDKFNNVISIVEKCERRHHLTFSYLLKILPI